MQSSPSFESNVHVAVQRSPAHPVGSIVVKIKQHVLIGKIQGIGGGVNLFQSQTVVDALNESDDDGLPCNQIT